jgi:hypothetical protein
LSLRRNVIADLVVTTASRLRQPAFFDKNLCTMKKAAESLGQTPLFSIADHGARTAAPKHAKQAFGKVEAGFPMKILQEQKTLGRLALAGRRKPA